MANVLVFDLMYFMANNIIVGYPPSMMKDLGIVYQLATPQSLGDCWWFWNCENVPCSLPPFLSFKVIDPMKCIGWGLSRWEAESIRDSDINKKKRDTEKKRLKRSQTVEASGSVRMVVCIEDSIESEDEISEAVSLALNNSYVVELSSGKIARVTLKAAEYCFETFRHKCKVDGV